MKYLFLALCLLACIPSMAYNDHRNARVDSLETALKSKNPPTGADLLKAYDELMRGYLPYDASKCEDYARKAITLSYRLNALNVRQNALRHIGLLRYGSENYGAALNCFQKALAVVDTMATLKHYSETDIDDARSSIYGSIANVYNMQDKAHLAIHYYQLALPIFERRNWLESQAILYYNIGELYGQMGNHQEAERNYRKAIEKGQASGDSLMMTMPRKGLLGVYLNTGDYDRALQTANEVLPYYQAHLKEEPASYAIILSDKSRVHLMKGHQDVTKAKACIEEALAINPEKMMFEDASEIYMAACEVAMAEKQWQEALRYALQSIHPDSTATIADKGGYMLLAEIYTELGQKEKAREYMQKAFELTNRYATKQYQSGLSQMEVIYETEKKEDRIAAMTRERSLYHWLLAAAAGLIALLVVLFIYRHLAHRRQKALLAARVAIETETNERRILARDLHDSLGGMLSLLKLKIEGKDDDVLQLLDDTHTELRRVSHHLMPDELLRKGLSPALHDFAISVPGARFQTVGQILLDKDKELVLYRCAYELVNNAMKHSKASHINIQLTQDAHEVTLTVSDNGRGMTANEGMGLQNIRERIGPYHGVSRIVSNENEGTEINVSLPL